MNVQSISLAFLATVAVGSVAYVFIYPMLSGENQAESRRANVAKPEPVAKASKPTDHEPRKPAPERHTPRPARSTPAAGGHSPFGSDGPVPAFLLRPTGAR